MREIERQHDDKLNIIRSMAASHPNNGDQFLNLIRPSSSNGEARVSSNTEYFFSPLNCIMSFYSLSLLGTFPTMATRISSSSFIGWK